MFLPHSSRRRKISLMLVGVMVTCATTVVAEEPKKVALLVGVNKYFKAGFEPLDYPEADVQAMGDELQRLGFQITVLTGSGQGNQQATLENIERAAKSLVQPLGRDDLMLVMLSGHGQQLRFPDPTDPKKERDDGFYCPLQAVPNEPATLFSLSHLTDDILAPNVGKKLVLIDACRNVPKDPGRGKGVQGKIIALPENTAILFGCRAGQQSYENDKLGHGLFTHCLLEGLQGKAARDGRLTWTNLAGYVEDRLGSDEMKSLMPKDRPQEPISAGGVGQLILARVEGNTAPTQVAPLVAPFNEKKATAAQIAWGKKLGQKVTLTNSLDMKFTLIPPGEFEMGGEKIAELKRDFPTIEKWNEDPDTKSELTSEMPRHTIRLTRPFSMGTYHVTKGQFADFVRSTNFKCENEKNGKGGRGYDAAKGLVYDPKYTWEATGFDYRDDHPVVNVSWNDATAFCKWLSEKEHATYRLPTEAEFEYACRAGTTTRFYNGNDPEGLIAIGNVTDARLKTKLSGTETLKGDDGYAFTAPVGKFTPNAFGLHEMLGNVPTWCADWFSEAYYANSPADNPTGPVSGKLKIYRGGGWLCAPFQCRAAYRHSDLPGNCCCCMGMRIMKEVETRP